MVAAALYVTHPKSRIPLRSHAMVYVKLLPVNPIMEAFQDRNSRVCLKVIASFRCITAQVAMIKFVICKVLPAVMVVALALDLVVHYTIALPLAVPASIVGQVDYARRLVT